MNSSAGPFDQETDLPWFQDFPELQGIFRTHHLAEPLSDMAAIYGEGYSRAWNRYMPADMNTGRVRGAVASRRYQQDMVKRSQPNGGPGVWFGNLPLPNHKPAPLPGQAVIYYLFDADSTPDDPAYIGSTDDLRRRLRSHVREKPGVLRWTARLYPDREAAYLMEEQLLRENLPRLNRKRAR